MQWRQKLRSKKVATPEKKQGISRARKQKSRDELFKVIDQIQEANAGASLQEVDKDVTEAVEAVRSQKK
jgi:hypothetical protein